MKRSRLNLPEVVEYLKHGNRSLEEYSSILLGAMNEHLHRSDVATVSRCVEWAASLHRDQRRGDGAPYIIHPLRVALISAATCESSQLLNVVVTSLLHDVIEDCDVSAGEISERYGPEVSRAVALLSEEVVEVVESRKGRRDRKLSKVARVENAGNPVVLVHLADKVDNALSLRNVRPGLASWEKIPRWLWQIETWSIPLAERWAPDLASVLREEVEYERRRGIEIGSWSDA